MKNKSLKLAINAVPLAPGGGLVGLIGYLEAWRELGLRLEITIYASREVVLKSVLGKFPEIKVIPFALGKKPSLHFFLQQTQLGKIITKAGFDVLMTTQYGLRKCRIPQLVHHRNLKRFRHNSVLQNLWLWKFSEFIKDYAARSSMLHANCNVFISNYMKEEAQKKVGISTDHDFVVYNGLSNYLLNIKAITPHRSSKLIAIQDTSEHKDNKTLINTVAYLCEKRPDINWQLNIAGAGDWSFFKKYSEKMKLHNKISFHGFLSKERINKLFEEALCLIFTSRIEAFGNPPLEAMAMGCPVVACNCTAMPEVIGKAGILIEPGNHQEFARSIIKLYEDISHRHELINNGFDRIQQFSWHTSALKMYELLYKIANRD